VIQGFSRVQEEDFDEDEGIYDDLNLDEEEEKFGLAPDDGDSDDSGEGSEGMLDSLKEDHTLCWHRHATPDPKET
jgi:CCR4-NOT transcriptional regulation complex NOT5 subunit